MTGQPVSLTAFWKSFRAKVVGRKFVQDVGILTVTNFVGAALSFAQAILVARWLGPELYGVAALVMSYPTLVYTFFDARSSEASVKYLSEFRARNELDRVRATCKLGYAVDFAIASIAFLVVAVSAHWAARSIVNRPEMTSLIIVCAAAFIPQALIGTSRSVLTVLGRFRLTALVEALMTILRVVLVLGLVMSGWQVTGVVWGNAIAMIATGLVYGVLAWVLTLRAWGGSPFQGNWQTLKGRWREILGFLAYSDLNALLGLISKQSDVLLLGYFRNPTEVGYYKLAKNLASGLSHLTGPLRSVTYPKLVHLWSAGRLSDFRRVLYKLAVTLAIPLTFGVILSVLAAPAAIQYFLGESYLEASVPTQFLLVATGLRLIGFWVSPFYLATGQVRLLTVFALAGAIGAIPIYAVCILFWGASGLAVSRLALTLLTDTTAAVLIMLWGIRTNYGRLSPKPMGSPIGN